MTSKTKILNLLLGLIFSGMASAANIPINTSHPDEYVVVKGDTLWGISGRFLQNPWQWPELWHSNPQVKNPHLIYPGDILSLILVDGKPRLHIRRKGGRNVKLSPHTRITKLDNAIPTIPIDAIQQFLSRPLIIGEKTLDESPYILSFENGRLVGGMNNITYARSINSADETNYTIYRKGNTYKDPETKEILGYEAINVANAKLLATGNPATLKITKSVIEALQGDRLIATEKSSFDQHFIPKIPSVLIRGQILAVSSGLTQIGQYNVVSINKGNRDGIEVGHVLHISKAGEYIRDTISSKPNDKVRLPERKIGTMMVFRTFEKISYALILKATDPIHTHDVVHTPK